jgi:plastocyanin
MTGLFRIATIMMLGAFGALAGTGAASAGGGGCHGQTTEGRGTTVEMIEACFTPSTLFAEPGDQITFVNRDPYEHNISAIDWGRFDDMLQGDQFLVSFDEAGVYAYACSIHPGMTGAIVIGDGDQADAAVSGVAAEAQPLSSPQVPADGDSEGRIATGVAGLLIGAAAGTGIAAVRRRSSDS